MADRKKDDRLTIKRDEETSRLLDGGQAPPLPEPLDPVADQSGELLEVGTPEPDDSYQSREGYHDLGGGFLPDEGEPNDELDVTEREEE